MGFLFNQGFSFFVAEPIEKGVGELDMAIFASEGLCGG